MPKKKTDTSPGPASFETALHRLEEIVSQLEHGEAPLEAALSLYEEGVGLARFCSSQVKDAERRVMLLEEKNGELRGRPFSRNGETVPLAEAADEEDTEDKEEPEETEDDEEDDEEEDDDSLPGHGGESQKKLF
jgi:exodeoxyribonuclease VII small subunit